jgi:hypothetical protein
LLAQIKKKGINKEKTKTGKKELLGYEKSNPLKKTPGNL